MAITKKPSNLISENNFIAGAPDARNESDVQVKQIKKLGHKSIITLSIDPSVLANLDAWAKRKGISRAAAVSIAVGALE